MVVTRAKASGIFDRVCVTKDGLLLQCEIKGHAPFYVPIPIEESHSLPGCFVWRFLREFCLHSTVLNGELSADDKNVVHLVICLINCLRIPGDLTDRSPVVEELKLLACGFFCAVKSGSFANSSEHLTNYTHDLLRKCADLGSRLQRGFIFNN